MVKPKVSCQNCKLWYHPTKADQCNIPSNGLEWKLPDMSDTFEGHEKFKSFMIAQGFKEQEVDQEYIDFAKRLNYLHFANTRRTYFFGHPSELNYDNTCLFFKPRLWARIKALFIK